MKTTGFSFALLVFAIIGTHTDGQAIQPKSKRCVCLKVTANCRCPPVASQTQPVYREPVPVIQQMPSQQPSVPCLNKCVQSCKQAQYQKCEQSCTNTCTAQQQYEPSSAPEVTSAPTYLPATSQSIVQYQPSPNQQQICISVCMPSCKPQCIQQSSVTPIPPIYGPGPIIVQPTTPQYYGPGPVIVQPTLSPQVPQQPTYKRCIQFCMPSCKPQCIQQSSVTPIPPIYGPGPAIVQPTILPQVSQQPSNTGCIQSCMPSCSQQCIQEMIPIPVIEQTTPVPVVQTPAPVYRPQYQTPAPVICIPLCMPTCQSECISRATYTLPPSYAPSGYYPNQIAPSNTAPIVEPSALGSSVNEVDINLPISVQQSPNCMNLCQESCVQKCVQQTRQTSQCQSSCSYACSNQCSAQQQYQQVNQYQLPLNEQPTVQEPIIQPTNCIQQSSGTAQCSCPFGYEICIKNGNSECCRK